MTRSGGWDGASRRTNGRAQDRSAGSRGRWWAGEQARGQQRAARCARHGLPQNQAHLAHGAGGGLLSLVGGGAVAAGDAHSPDVAAPSRGGLGVEHQRGRALGVGADWLAAPALVVGGGAAGRGQDGAVLLAVAGVDCVQLLHRGLGGQAGMLLGQVCQGAVAEAAGGRKGSAQPPAGSGLQTSSL
ncbi:hypothetical protein ABPG77_000195 [Micractinium sp. CCAP 211/92]